HLYVKQMVPQADGTTAFVYPPLQYSGAHLQGRSQLADIGGRALRGAAWGGVAGLALSVVLWLLCAALARRRPLAVAGDALAGRAVAAWRSMWVTLMLLAVITGVVATLSANYHVLGTDKLGQDVLYETLKSIRTGVLIGTLTTLVMLPF